MTRRVTVELAEAIARARRVQRALPIDEEADRLAASALRRHRESQPPPRKLRPKKSGL